MSALRDAAIRYAQRGLPVFPCRPRMKVPATGNGMKDATTDVGLITGWWEQWPDANIGLRTGKPSGIVVLDVDGEEGTESLRRLTEQHEPLAPTVQVATPRGDHYWVRWPGRHIGCSVGKIAPGIDVRGDGGYVIAPPSQTRDGVYRPVVRGRLADPPAWMLDAAATVNRRCTPTGAWLQIVDHGADQGARNSELTRLVGHLLARDVDARLVLEIALCVNIARFRPPLDATEVEKVAESIAGRELRKRGQTS